MMQAQRTIAKSVLGASVTAQAARESVVRPKRQEGGDDVQCVVQKPVTGGASLGSSLRANHAAGKHSQMLE